MAIQAVSASAFTDSLAVQVHLQYNAANGMGGSPYNNVGQVINEINYLNPNGPGTGVAVFRDNQFPGAALLSQVAGATSSRADLYVSYNPSGGNDLSYFESVADSLLAQGQLASVEGGLEVDNSGWGLTNHGGTYGGASGWQAVVKMQQDLYNHYHGHVPVALWSLADPSNGSAYGAAVQAMNQLGLNIGSITDQGNFHFYAHNGQNPAVEMGGFLAQETGYTPNMAFMTTETGFNDGNNSGGSLAGNAHANGVYTIENVLNLFKAGCTETVLYELNNDEVSGGFEDYWGLFNDDGSPKAAATYLRNFLAVVSDARGGGGQSTATLNSTITGMRNPGDTLLTQKADGTLDLTLWDNQNLSDSAGNALQPAAQSVHVDFGQSFGSVQVFDPTRGTQAIQTLSNVSAIDLNLAGGPLIVQMTSGSGGTASPAPAAAPASTASSAPASADANTATAVAAAAGNDTLVVNVSEDTIAAENAQFTVSIDGTQVGGTQTTTVHHGTGQSQPFTFTGNWGSGQHSVVVTFLNDPTCNLYVSGMSYDGTSYPGATASIYGNGPVAFTVGSTGTSSPPPATAPGNAVTLTGDARFTVSSDQTVNCSSGTDTINVSAGNVTVNGSSGVLNFVGGGAGSVALNLTGGSTNALLGNGPATVNVAGHVIATDGNGADLYVFTRDATIDTAVIYNFKAGTDHLQLANYGPGTTGVAWATDTSAGYTIGLTDGTAIGLVGLHNTSLTQLLA